MQEAAAAAAPHGPPDNLGQRAELPHADVFNHADRDKRIELAGDVPVIIVDELDTITQPFTASTRARVRQLLLRDIEGLDLDPIVPRHVHRQRSPAAAGFDDGIARAKMQLPANQIELGALSLFQ